MFNISICCNDIKQTAILSKYLHDFSKSNNFKYKASKFNSFDHLVNSPPKNLDILFLSINLSNKELVHSIYKQIKALYKNSQIIFMPEIIDFMLNGFYLKDFKSILKPLKYSAFEDELSSCIKDIKTLNNLNPNSNLEKTNNIVNFKNLLPNNKPLYLLCGIPTKSILFIESRGKVCIAYTSNGFVSAEYTINELESKLNTSNFFRCHDEYIINVKKISKLNKSSVVINSNIIPVSNDKFKLLKNKLLIMLKII